MRAAQATVLAGILFAGAARGGVEPGLPAWNEGARAGWEAGAWPLTDPSRQAAAERLDVAPPTAEEIAATDKPMDEIPGKFWPAYFGERPRAFLIDPQGLLSSVEHQNHLAFLNDHAADSLIDLFVYVFKGDQEIPGEVRAEELIERFFLDGRPAALVFYYLGAPQRSVLYLSPSLTDVVAVAEQRRALESSVMQAIGKTDPSGQIEAFLVQMSIRIYWMERMVGGGVATAGATPDFDRKAKGSDHPSATMEKLRPLIESARRFAVPAGGGAVHWWQGG